MSGGRRTVGKLSAATIIAFLLIPVQTAIASTDSNWDGTEIIVHDDQPLEGQPDSPKDLAANVPEVPLQSRYIYEFRNACTDGDSRLFEECIRVVADCGANAGNPDVKPGDVVYRYKARTDEQPVVWTFDSGPHCIRAGETEKPVDVLAEIASRIAEEFQRVPIVGATVGSQPGPHTLRGKETNVWAQAATQHFELDMLGQNVTITATPKNYTWDYGDGTIWGPTPNHGAPLHQDRIGEQTRTSHIYTQTGEKYLNLTTHFTGSYTVNNGPELPIPGQGNIPSPPVWIKVWRAETHLYADNCITNPHGTGC